MIVLSNKILWIVKTIKIKRKIKKFLIDLDNLNKL